MDIQGIKEESKESIKFFLYFELLISVLILDGCITITREVDEFQEWFRKKWREPGEKMVRSPEETAEIYSCQSYRGNKLILEDVEVLPTKVSPGEEIDQRVRYAFCPDIPSGTMKGKIIRTILFKGEKIVERVTDYEFKPGTWAVDVFIVIPDGIQSGVYAFDVVLTYSQETIKGRDTFIVKSR